MAAPRPQLIVSDGNDWTSTVPQSEFPFVRRAYQLYNADDAVRNVHLPDEQHDYGPSKRQAVYRFFAAAFKLPLKDFVRPDGSVDESANIVEPVELLHAFDETHVLPQGALKGWDAVSNALHGLQQTEN